MGSAGENTYGTGLHEPIAIVGTGCRFAGDANTPSRLWDLLKNPPDLLSKVPADRFSAEGFHNTNNAYHGNSNVRHSYFLSDETNVRGFDAHFFGIKPVEANAIDPQQRMLLEVVYEALERGGHPLGDLRGSDTAVYVGVMCGDYEALLLRDTDSMPTYHATGIARSILSNRISYFFDWHGPSMTIDTACSSSLIALHQAVQVLRSGSSRVAVAAGTNLILGPENYIGESKLKMLSPNGRSRMWDAGADGYARGEGVAAVVLKRLSDALRDGDVIEAIVRETGTNQDGRTRGITMPSATAQTSLIRQVYRAAGLDLTQPRDRPQFFEAHGTGTPAGDPIEAEAIRDAFFPQEAAGQAQDGQVLHVGSIKTVMGHTEGTAGLAAVIKASLAVQHGVIPPNLLFDKLNPRIEEFYHHLRVPTAPQEWPQLPPGQPRRVSVNSFGFGGANAHAIIESFTPSVESKLAEAPQEHPIVPFVFSANSQKSLRALLGSFADYLETHKETVNLSDLSWALQRRRSRLPVGTTFSATSVNHLIEQLSRASSNESVSTGTVLSSSSSLTAGAPRPRLLGIFTGQGAQWAGMGRELLVKSPFARARLEYLEAQLQNLPASDRPSWSLRRKLVDKEDIGEAAVSQPLCTAVQIILVDLARAAGITFQAVVGHSSGEIAAAYAAGNITAEDACRVSYYRGLHAAKACGPGGKAGRMMAVTTTRDDAQDLCDLPHFSGRICVAANNGPRSVTMSGDEDAVLEAKVVFEDENKSAKLLVVDKAYHSHHMLASAQAYEKDLATFAPKFDLGAGAEDPANRTRWFSSVYDQEVSEIPEKMNDKYWNTNMVGSVLFADALETAWRQAGPFDAIIEVGPHPALKRPSLDTIEAVAKAMSSSPSHAKASPPYFGLLSRGKDDVTSFSQGLGQLWTVLPSGAGSVPDLEAYEDKFLGIKRAKGLRKLQCPDLPAYPWDREKEYWHESRASRAFRTRQAPTHLLLGNLQADRSNDKQLQWRNLLSVREVPWLDGHKLQGQTVFPAAGYCSMALEAGQALLRLGGQDRTARTMELIDVMIHNALVFQDDDTVVETVFTISDIQTTEDTATAGSDDDGLGGSEGVIHASWTLYSSNTTINESALQTPPPMAAKASGSLRMVLGPADETVMPERGAPEPLMIEVDHNRFYTSLADVGYGYTGRFRALDNLSRKAGFASGTISHDVDSCRDGLIVHPSSLDTAIQAVILAFCYPYDGELFAIHVPTKIKSLRINPELCNRYFATVPGQDSTDSVILPFDAVLGNEEGAGLLGDVDVFTPGSSARAVLQLEGVQCVLFAPATPADDRLVFSSTSWGPLEPNCVVISTDMRAAADQHSFALDLERACLYYMQEWERQVPADSPARRPGHDQHGLFRYSAHVRDQVAKGHHAYATPEWLNDGPEVLEAILERHPESSLDLRVINVVGRKIPDVVDGKTTILEHLFQDDLLTQYYANALGFPPCTTYLARAMAQLSHRYPAMDILEIGAGTGHATRKVLGEIGSAFNSYTFTDLSAGFLDKAQTAFAQSAVTSGVVDKMSFRVLDIEKDITSQGYTPSTFDVVVASFVLHATRDLEQTLANARMLLKPGGYLMLVELLDNAPMRSGFIFGSLPGWWAGENDGRVLSPCVEVDRWDTLLRKTGFSGAESFAHNIDDRLPFPAGVIVSQALDDRIKLLREPLDELPLLAGAQETIGGELLIVGGQSLVTSRVIPRIRRHLQPYYETVGVRKSFADLSETDVSPSTTILNLSDLDTPIFENLTAEGWRGLRACCENSQTIVWLTAGAGTGLCPYANMSLGFGRSVLWEVPGLQLQFIDIEQQDKRRAPSLDAAEVASALLRFSLASEWEAKGQLGAMTWSNELELCLSQAYGAHGLAMYSIPRLKAAVAQNNRFNSSQRRITQSVDRETQAVKATLEGQGSWVVDYLAPIDQLSKSQDSEDVDLIEVQLSSLGALRVGCGALYAIIGHNKRTGARVLALTDQPASHVSVRRTHAVVLPSSLADPTAFLSTACWRLLASSILAEVLPGDILLVHEPPVELAKHMSRQAAVIGANIRFTTTSSKVLSPEFVLAPASIARRDLRRIIPNRLTTFIDMSSLADSSTDAKHMGHTIALLLPRDTNVLHIESFLQSRSRQVRAADSDLLISSILKDLDLVEPVVNQDHVQPAPISIAKLAAGTSTYDVEERIYQRLLLLDWQSQQTEEPLLTVVRPVDYKPLFRADRSYWLVGLTGDLGLSLAEWMVESGANHIILSSRNPKIDERWLSKMKARGDNHIHVFANDVTDVSDVRRVVEQIRTDLPPLAGVAQGAMVLRDTLINDMDIETMHSVLRPKVLGSINLQQVLSPGNQDDGLDFFVYFSSMTQIVGNLGQSNYTAANAFMASLAQQRRRAGLSASVINIGAIIGVGYVTREASQASQDNLLKGGYQFLSAHAFHNIFAEAVLAGRSGQGDLEDVEISSGLQHVRSTDRTLPVWFSNPRFWHHVVRDDGKKDGQDSGNAGGQTVSIASSLAEATNPEQVINIVQDGFLAKLANLLRSELTAGSGALGLRTDEIGVDSLVAVEIRTWFLKTMQVNVPVLKILGGASIGDIINHAVANLPKDLTPSLSTNGSPDHKTPASAVAPARNGEQDSRSRDQSAPTSMGNSSTASTASTASPGVSSLPSSLANDSVSSETSSVGAKDEFYQQDSRSPPTSVTEVVTHSHTATPVPSSTIKVLREGPLSYNQSMFWFVHKFAEDPSTLNHTGLFRLRGRLRIAKLRAAVERVAQHHEALRTKFCDDISPTHQRAVQAVLAENKFVLETRTVKSAEMAYDAFAELRDHVYDLEHGESMRLMLLSASADEHYLLVGCHHINVDGWTQQVLMRDLDGAYKGHDLPKTLQYLDYTLRQQEEKLSNAWDADLAFWKQILAPDAIPSPLPVLPLPGSRSRSVLSKYDFHRVKTMLSQSLVDKLTRVSRTARATPFQFFLAALRVLIARVSGVQDFAVGIGHANRNSPDTRNAIGAYIDILPLIFSQPPADSFAAMLQDTRGKVMDALAHSSVPFGAVLETVQPPRSEYHSPIFQVFVDYREGQEAVSSILGAEMELLEFEGGRTAYDINIDVCNYVGDTGAGIELMVQSSIYSASDAQLLLDCYVRLLDELPDNLEVATTKVSVYKPDDVNEALLLGQGPVIASEWPETLIHRVVDIAKQHATRSAIKDGHGNEMTYKELLDRTHVLSNALRAAEVHPGDVVAVLQDRTCDWIASLLAVMHVGATYLPLDPDTPIPRLASIAQDSKPTAILADATTSETVSILSDVYPNPHSVIDLSRMKVQPEDTQSYDVLAEPNGIGAVLYTSGSTGTPKGILLRHSNLRNEVEFSGLTYNLDATNGERVLQQSAPGFDMSLTQIFGALAFGGFLYICPASIRADAMSITQIMVDEKITMTGGTPSEYLSWIGHRSLDARLSSWRVAISGGEAVRDSLLKAFDSLDVEDLRLYNAYGPTEVTCSATRQMVDYRALPHQDGEATSITAGKAAPNAHVYIVDTDNLPVPVGVSGEIVVGGAGIAAGYLGRPQETAARFVMEQNQRQTVHKTGDIGRLTPTGELVIQGRIDGDTQVKLRGIRIDLLEVEKALLHGFAAHGIIDVVVSLRKLGSESASLSTSRECLIAHAVFSGEGSPSAAQIRDTITALSLPAQMKPSAVFSVSELPRGLTGKVDRKAVTLLPLAPQHQSGAMSDFEQQPLSEVEEVLRGVWATVIPPEVLGDITMINADTDFFHVGGNSLLLVDLQRAIQSTFNTSTRLVSLFESSTLSRMAQLVSPSYSGPIASNVNWDAETEPMDLAQTAPVTTTSPTPQVVSPPRVIVLTGATGHLGRELLRQLLINPSVETVHCIAVRAQSASSLDYLRQLDTQGKAHVHLGNLSSPALGLGPEAAQAIFSTADIIIHNGANVSHLKHYQTLKAENLGSTAELVQLARPRNIPIHFVSTAGVALFTGNDEFAEVSCSAYTPPSEAEGYTASKWASEVLLEKASARFGMSVTIHRPSNIARDDVPELDLFQNLIKYCRITKSVPHATGTNLSGHLNLVSVEDCGNGILSEALRQDQAGAGSAGHVRYLHQIGLQNLSFGKLAEYIEVQDSAQGKLEALPLMGWVEKAEERGMHSTVGTYFRRAAQGEAIKYPRLIKSSV